MSPLFENAAFWRSNEPWIATDPHRVSDAEGLADFAKSHQNTKSLLYFQTSGSEGQSKWVGLSRAAFLTSAASVNNHLQATDADRWLIALPLHHVGGFSILARCHMSGASFAMVTGRWNAAEFVQQCDAERISLTSLVPTQVFDLVQAGLRAPSALRAIVVGGGALAKPMGLRAQELGWPVLQSYGMTEACSQIATEPLNHLNKSFDPDALEVLPHWHLTVNVDGQLIVRGEALAEGYAVMQDGKWDWQPLDARSGLITRDRVELSERDARQFLRFLGRESSFVKVKGELVSVLSVQQRIDDTAHRMGVHATLVVCALPDARRDTRLVLVGKKGAISENVLAEVAAHHGLECPPSERISDVRVVDEFPLNGPGKIDLVRLQQMLR